MCPMLFCLRSAGPRRRALFFYVAAWLGWLLGGFELGLTVATDGPFLTFLDTPPEQQPVLLAALLAVHAAAAGLGGLITGLWVDSVVETRALVIMAGIPQLLGATLYFFAGTLGELILARLLTGVGAGAAVAMLSELLRMATLRARVAALAGLAMSRELGADIGPTIALRLDELPALPLDVLRHRVTPWNAAGLLLLVCHLFYILLLFCMYPNLTLERETELLELRRLAFPEATAAEEAAAGGDERDEERRAAEEDAAYQRHVREVRQRLRMLTLEMFEHLEIREPECSAQEELPRRAPLTPSPPPDPPRTASELAAIGHAFANPGPPQPLLPSPQEAAPAQEVPEIPPRKPAAAEALGVMGLVAAALVVGPVADADARKGPLGAEAAPAESEETDGVVTASSFEEELQFPMSSRPTSDEEKGTLRKLTSDSGAEGPGARQTTSGDVSDSSLRARRWPGAPDITVAAPTSPLTPVEKTGWFTPEETPGAAGSARKDPSAAGHAEQGSTALHPLLAATSALDVSRYGTPTAALSQRTSSVDEPQTESPTTEPPEMAESAAESPREAGAVAEPLQQAEPAAESDPGSPSNGTPLLERLASATEPTRSTTPREDPSTATASRSADSSFEVIQIAPDVSSSFPDPEPASRLHSDHPDTPQPRTSQDPERAPRRHSDRPDTPRPRSRSLQGSGTAPRRRPDRPDSPRPWFRSFQGQELAQRRHSLRPGSPRPQSAEGQRRRSLGLDLPDRARPPTCRPLEGPYADAPEATTEMLLAHIQHTIGVGYARRAQLNQREMWRALRGWERLAVAPVAVLLVCCLVTVEAQSALLSLMPREDELGPVGLNPRWMLGVTAVFRLFTSTILMTSIMLENGLGAGTAMLSLFAMMVSHCGLAVTLMELHAYSYNWSFKPPTEGQVACAWVLRVALCLQSVAVALFEPAALALFSQMVPRTMMGRGVSFWALATRFGLLLGPFWTVSLIGYPLPQFLLPMGALAGCFLSVFVSQCIRIFHIRKTQVRLMDAIGPRLPMVGLRGRTLSVINHLRQFYRAQGGGGADAEGGAAVAPEDGAPVAPIAGDRIPLLVADRGR